MVAARIVVGTCAVSAGAHAGLVPEHVREAPQLGVVFGVAAGLLVAAGTLDAVGATTKLVEGLGLVFALRLSRPVGGRRPPLTQEIAR